MSVRAHLNQPSHHLNGATDEYLVTFSQFGHVFRGDDGSITGHMTLTPVRRGGCYVVGLPAFDGGQRREENRGDGIQGHHFVQACSPEPLELSKPE